MPPIKKYNSYLPQTPATVRANSRLRLLVERRRGLSAAEIMRQAFDAFFAAQPDHEEIDAEIDKLIASRKRANLAETFTRE